MEKPVGIRREIHETTRAWNECIVHAKVSFPQTLLQPPLSLHPSFGFSIPNRPSFNHVYKDCRLAFSGS